uniref:Tissue- and phase-specific nuclear protein n=1 Tax=Podarcis siculus TaxID=65484 RepID=SNP_PODSI|nr:RecName: Full=Tissue- and phase-specific nuclear protein; AltName: Full=Specific nuclear protein; Short=SNP [Podarcis siculus]
GYKHQCRDRCYGTCGTSCKYGASRPSCACALHGGYCCVARPYHYPYPHPRPVPLPAPAPRPAPHYPVHHPKWPHWRPHYKA